MFIGKLIENYQKPKCKTRQDNLRQDTTRRHQNNHDYYRQHMIDLHHILTIDVKPCFQVSHVSDNMVYNAALQTVLESVIRYSIKISPHSSGIICYSHQRYCNIWKHTLIAKFVGPTRGPPGADRTQVGPMLASWTLLSGQLLHFLFKFI